MTKPTIAFYLPSLAGGGAERSTLRLVDGLIERGYAVELVVNHATGPYLEKLPPAVTLIELKRGSKWRVRLKLLKLLADVRPGIIWRALGRRKPVLKIQFLGALMDYLATTQARVVVGVLYDANLLLACASACRPVGPPIVVSVRNVISKVVELRCQRNDGKAWADLPLLMGYLYPKAERIIAVSNGVADDLSEIADIDRARIETIYNPVVSAEIDAAARQVIGHPWFDASAIPVIVAAGRLEPQKDFATLIAAFASLRKSRDARLMILGTGWMKESLAEQAKSLGIEADLAFIGWVADPASYIARADLFVLSSRFEGLPGVLIEALACGCPIVSTDCPSGPREILEDGRYGSLVPVGDVEALAVAIDETLSADIDRAVQKQRSRFFSVGTAVDTYERLFDALIEPYSSTT